MNGLDDRRISNGVLTEAEDLMADAVDAERAYFSTCGSSLSVKSAMLAVAGPGEKLLVSRNAHKFVVAGLIISGVEPVWVDYLRSGVAAGMCIPDSADPALHTIRFVAR